jgi:hypothetical protein
MEVFLLADFAADSSILLIITSQVKNLLALILLTHFIKIDFI